MDLNADWEIVGFDGLPVAGGIGRKPALVYDRAGDRYAVISGGRPRRMVAPNELDDAIARKLVTRLGDPLGPWDPERCVFYLDIVQSPALGTILLRDAQTGARQWDPSSGCLVCSQPLDAATALFKRWGDLFLGAAEVALARWDWRLSAALAAQVIDRVGMARYCIIARGTTDRGQLERAAELLIAAFFLNGRQDDPALQRDLRLDFDADECARLRGAAIARLPKKRARGPLNLWTDVDDHGAIRRESRCI